ncbi:hypothetical protein ACLOJK_014307, partial [Asimina triloba]
QSTSLGLDAAQAWPTIAEKRVAKLEGELCHALKVKREDDPSESNALMLVSTIVQDVMLGEYLNNMTFRSREASNHSYIRDGHGKRFEDVEVIITVGANVDLSHDDFGLDMGQTFM